MTRQLFILLAVLSAAFVAKLWLESSGELANREQPHVTLESAQYESRSLQRIHLGFRNLVANLLWIQLLQDAAHTPKREDDEVTWEFAQANALTDLDPNFDPAYHFGSIFLSVFRRDNIGAERLLQKWVQRAPNEWNRNYLLGYHLFYEMKRYEEASQYILKASKLPNAPDWITSLGVALIEETGATFSAPQVALDVFPSLHSTEGRYRLQRRIENLRTELYLQAWRESIEAYKKRYRRQPASLDDARSLFAQKRRRLDGLIAKLDIPEALVPLFQQPLELTYDSKTNSLKVSDYEPKQHTPGIFRPKK